MDEPKGDIVRAPILPPNGRVIAYVVGLENYVGTGKIKPVDYARRDARAFAEALRIAFSDREVDVMTRIDDEATRSVWKTNCPTGFPASMRTICSSSTSRVTDCTAMAATG